MAIIIILIIVIYLEAHFPETLILNVQLCEIVSQTDNACKLVTMEHFSIQQ